MHIKSYSNNIWKMEEYNIIKSSLQEAGQFIKKKDIHPIFTNGRIETLKLEQIDNL